MRLALFVLVLGLTGCPSDPEVPSQPQYNGTFALCDLDRTNCSTIGGNLHAGTPVTFTTTSTTCRPYGDHHLICHIEP